MPTKLKFIIVGAVIVAGVGFFLLSQKRVSNNRSLPTNMSSEKSSSNSGSENGRVTLRGVLFTEETRQGAPLLETETAVIFLDADYFAGQAGQPANAWHGKTVEIKGKLTVRPCGPYEACLDGELRYMDQIEFVRLISF
ncbi:hypothetical protein HY628_00840 [Candidatus Uhrbacteria bacterium]|nr:hypothetical protein [Candidatus Uhrbacteria bacterium]